MKANNYRLTYLPEKNTCLRCNFLHLKEAAGYKKLEPNVICKKTNHHNKKNPTKKPNKQTAVLKHFILYNKKQTELFKPLRKDNQKSIFHTSLCAYN